MMLRLGLSLIWAKLDEDRGYGAASGAGLLIDLIGGL